MTRNPFILIFVVVVGLLANRGVAQSPDPSTLPRLEQADLVNVGGFKVPDTEANGHFNYGGGVMAFHPDGPSLLLTNWGRAAQITIPTPVLSGSISALPRASYVKPFVVVLTAERAVGAGRVKADTLGGLLVHDGRLYGTAYVYYDGNNTQERSHFSHSLDLTDAASFRGWSQVWSAKSAGFVGGPMTPIPPEWQAKLGGTAITGLCCVPIVSRTSFGPAAFAFDPTKIGQPKVPASPLVYYPSDHPNLGSWSGSNPIYGGTTLMGGSVIVPGTRTMLFFGSNGVGPNCYGLGTHNKAAHNPAKEICYDPVNPADEKGSHAYPYKYQVWAYDLNDLAAVKAGRKRPWDVKPYGVWPIDLPITHGFQVRFSSVAINPATGRIYAAQYKGEIHADGGGQPVIWNFDPRIPAPTPKPGASGRDETRDR